MARKEFVDLLSNPVVLVVIIAYLVYSIFVIYDYSIVFFGGRPGVTVLFQDNPGVACANSIFYSITWIGTLIGIIIGCSTISSERFSNAINTLIVKPLYRDTVINGKLLGSIAFLTFTMVLIIATFTAGFLILCGNAFSAYLLDYLARLPFVLIFALIYVLVFLLLSMLISLLVRDQAFAMILSILTVYLSLIVYFYTISAYIDNILPGSGLGGLLVKLSPRGILEHAQPLIMNTGVDAYDAFLDCLPDFLQLLLYMIICLVLSYIVFVKRDIL
ncbi:ABC transporter permease [Methanocella arvoryzae]|nr:ABC transporter permease [Methanocella arvoryzae]